MDLKVRKVVVQIETVLEACGQPVSPPTQKVVAAAVIANPYAGKFVEDLRPLYPLGGEISDLLTRHALAALDAAPGDISSYGKGAIVGLNGDLEHTAAILHPQFGAPVRSQLGGGKAIIPGTKKIGAAGTQITMPLGNTNDIWVFDDMDSAEISIPDAPRPDEILVAVCLGIGGRPNHRVSAN